MEEGETCIISAAVQFTQRNFPHARVPAHTHTHISISTYLYKYIDVYGRAHRCRKKNWGKGNVEGKFLLNDLSSYFPSFSSPHSLGATRTACGTEMEALMLKILQIQKVAEVGPAVSQ